MKEKKYLKIQIKKISKIKLLKFKEIFNINN